MKQYQRARYGGVRGRLAANNGDVGDQRSNYENNVATERSQLLHGGVRTTTTSPVAELKANAHRAGIPSRYVTSELGQLSLASLRGRLIEYQLRLG